MVITKAKLMKGTFLAIEGHDGSKEFKEAWPKIEASPKMLKAFQALNHDVCDLCEQFDATGEGDYDNVVFRGYSRKEGEETQSVILTGLRTLSTGRTITLNTPSVNLDAGESDYPHIAKLISGLERINIEILAFLENNKSPDQLQGNLFKKETIILEAHAPQTAADIIFKDINDASARNAKNEDEETIKEGVTGPERGLTAKIDKEKSHAEKQAEIDAKEPIKSRLIELQEKAKVTQLSPEEQGELQKLNADEKKKKKK